MPDLKSLLKSLPGAVRWGYLKHRLGSLGRSCDIQPRSVFEYPRRVHLGDACRIARGALLRANTDATAGIRLGDRSLVQEHALLNANRGHIHIGTDSWVGPYCLLYGNGGIDIGNNVMVAAHASWKPMYHSTCGLKAAMAAATMASVFNPTWRRPTSVAKSARLPMIAARTTAASAPTRIV